MKKQLSLTLLVLSSVTFASELPQDFAERSLFCQTWLSQETESKKAAFDKFNISKEDEFGIRHVSFKNSKQDFPCVEDEAGLTCEGEAYQILHHQLLEETTEDQKFKAVVKLDYNNLGKSYVHGTGIIPKEKWYHLTKKADLNCSWE